MLSSAKSQREAAKPELRPYPWVWFNGELVSWEDARVPILTHALHYGTGVFEGIRAYPTDGNLAVFRLQNHLARLLSSGKAIYLNSPFGVEQLANGVLELLRKSGVRESSYVRPLMFVGYSGIDLDIRRFPVHIAISAFPFAKYFTRSGIRVGVSSWRRIGDNSMSPSVKATANYLNSVLAKTEAGLSGYDEAILLNERGLVSEATGENIFLVERGTLVTPTLASSILEGITRDSVIQLAGAEGLKVMEREVIRSELYLADEALLTGTAAEISPILAVDGHPVGNGQVGPITARLQTAFASVVNGHSDRFRTWLTPVY